MGLKIYNDKTPVVLEQSIRQDVTKKISELYHLLGFLNQNIKDDTLDNNVVDTTMSLYETYYRDLAKMLNYDTILQKEHEERFAEIRQKNKKIDDLTSKLGEKVSPDAVTGAIRLYNDIFSAWYENEGFHYARVTENAYGLNIELCDEMDYNQDDTIEDKRDEINSHIWSKNKNAMQKKESGWDIDEDKYHASILDTDNNRQRMQSLILSDFPKARVNGFQSRRNDNKLFSLRTNLFIPYADIVDYYEKQKIPKAYCGHNFTLEELQSLKSGNVVEIIGCKRGVGNAFDAKVKINAETGKLMISFDNMCFEENKDNINDENG